MKGYTSTCGTAFLCEDNVSEEDSAVVQCMKLEGAIPLVRGNVPQAMYSIHTTNYIFGEALNPKDNSRSCGGSSGGDAGLVAAGCVPLGIGGDIGGSIRFPAVFCGIYGFKPT